jgi:hypothetical protein
MIDVERTRVCELGQQQELRANGQGVVRDPPTISHHASRWRRSWEFPCLTAAAMRYVRTRREAFAQAV